MANVTTVDNNTVTITGLDADWLWTSDMPSPLKEFGAYIKSITFVPSGQNDRMIIRDGGIDNAAIADFLNPEANPPTKIWYNNFPHLKMKPVIDISDCVLATAGNARVHINLI